MADYASKVLADNPVGYWRLGDSESYAQAVVRDGAIGFWRLGESAGAATAADSSGNGRSGTYNAGVAPGSVGVLADGNGAADFSGVANAYVINGNSLASITAAASFEAFVNPDTLTGGVYKLIVGSSLSTSYIAIDSGNLPTASFNIASVQRALLGVAALTPGSWWHIVGTYDGDKIRLYINGNLVSTSPSFVGALGFGSGTWRIGTNGSGTEPFDGRIDEVAIYNVALTAAQVANHYALRLSTRSTTAALVATDTTPAGRNGTYVGGVTLAQASPLADGTTAARFDGASGYVTVPNATALQIVGDFTLELWVNLASLAVRQTVVTKNSSNEFELTIEPTGNVNFYNATESVISSPGIVVVGAWCHIVVTRVVATKTITIYANGVAVKTGVYTLVVASSISPVQIGRSSAGAQFTNGSIDEVALYAATLTPAQIAAHYAQALAAFVSAPITAGRQYLLGVPGGGVSSGTGPWIAVGYRSCRLLVTTIGSGTITGGSVQLEETDDPQDGSGATPMALGTAINCVSVSGNAKACTHLGPGAYGYIRARVSADVVGGGSVCLSLAGMP